MRTHNAQDEPAGLSGLKYGFEEFGERLRNGPDFPLRAEEIETFQMNVGKRCNLSCEHCHVEAGPARNEVMPGTVMDRCLDVVKRTSSIVTVDITGGSPEMNPGLERFIVETARLGKRIIVRTNLVILQEEEYSKFMKIYADNGVEICASLPCYLRENVDRQRGSGVYDKCVRVLGMLNDLGYGQDGTGLILDITHNPCGALLPGRQNELERDYKCNLKREHGVAFNKLFCMTNVPVGRYFDYLERTNNVHNYMLQLANLYNPDAVRKVMCRTTISVAWDGNLYDCDFNQMLELPVKCGRSRTVEEFDAGELGGREIATHNHCYACTAGPGSSCRGSLG